MMNKDIDPKLLRVIHSIVTCGSAVEASYRLNMSTGNISYLLGKARRITGSHLFIRTNRGLRPDTTALELSHRYQQYFEGGLYRGVKKRSNSEKMESLSINAHSLMEMLFCSYSMEQSEINGDELKYKFKSYISKTDDRLSRVKNKLIDIDIGDILPADSEINSVKLFTSEVGILTSSKHRPKGTVFTYKEWCSSRHIVWSTSPNYYNNSICGTKQVLKLNNSRDTAVISESLINMVSLCSNTSYIMLIPSFFSRLLECNFPVHFHPLDAGVNMYCDQYLHYNTALLDDDNIMSLIDLTISSIINGKNV